MRTELHGYSHGDKCNSILTAENGSQWQQGALGGSWMGTGSIDHGDHDGGIWHDALSFAFGAGQVGNA